MAKVLVVQAWLKFDSRIILSKAWRVLIFQVSICDLFLCSDLMITFFNCGIAFETRSILKK